MEQRPIKVGVTQGQGSPPGYEWSVWILDVAFDESQDFLGAAQYEHIALQMKELATHNDPTHSDTLSIRSLTPEDFHELRDKGGVLGKMNIRVFFGVDKPRRAIVVLGSIKKQNDGPTPQGDLVRMRRRWRMYKSGELRIPTS